MPDQGQAPTVEPIVHWTCAKRTPVPSGYRSASKPNEKTSCRTDDALRALIDHNSSRNNDKGETQEAEPFGCILPIASKDSDFYIKAPSRRLQPLPTGGYRSTTYGRLRNNGDFLRGTLAKRVDTFTVDGKVVERELTWFSSGVTLLLMRGNGEKLRVSSVYSLQVIKTGGQISGMVISHDGTAIKFIAGQDGRLISTVAQT